MKRQVQSRLAKPRFSYLTVQVIVYLLQPLGQRNVRVLVSQSFVGNQFVEIPFDLIKSPIWQLAKINTNPIPLIHKLKSSLLCFNSLWHTIFFPFSCDPLISARLYVVS
ncbi:MAG: hypothetical protein ACRC10_01025 [Thermoguttaceae bacterium]